MSRQYDKDEEVFNTLHDELDNSISQDLSGVTNGMRQLVQMFYQAFSNIPAYFLPTWISRGEVTADRVVSEGLHPIKALALFSALREVSQNPLLVKMAPALFSDLVYITLRGYRLFEELHQTRAELVVSQDRLRNIRNQHRVTMHRLRQLETERTEVSSNLEEFLVPEPEGPSWNRMTSAVARIRQSVFCVVSSLERMDLNPQLYRCRVTVSRIQVLLFQLHIFNLRLRFRRTVMRGAYARRMLLEGWTVRSRRSCQTRGAGTRGPRFSVVSTRRLVAQMWRLRRRWSNIQRPPTPEPPMLSSESEG